MVVRAATLSKQRVGRAGSGGGGGALTSIQSAVTGCRRHTMWKHPGAQRAVELSVESYRVLP